MKKGKTLERIIHTIEKHINSGDNIIVESPKKIRDVITNRLREHDVVITINQSHHSILIAIECRDRSRPISVNQVESFYTKCTHTKISKGIIVSSRGFTKGAKIKANFLNIRCLDLVNVESFNWLQIDYIQSIERNILNADWIFNSKHFKKNERYELIDNNKNIITVGRLNELLKEHFDSIIPSPFKPIERGVINIKMPVAGIFAKYKEINDVCEMEFAEICITYSIQIKKIPIDRYIYKDENNDIAEIAKTKIQINDNIKNLYFTKTKNGITIESKK